MVSSDVIVATCRDSVSSHLMSFCVLQLWHNGQVAWAIFHTDTYTLRTKINCRAEDLEALWKGAGLASMLLPDDLLIILLTIKSKSHSSVKPCLGNVRNRGLLPNSTDSNSIACVLCSTASPECSPGSAESHQRCNKPHKEKWADTDKQIQ